MDHVDAVQSQAVQRYLLSELTGDELALFEDHMFGCGECAAGVRDSYVFAANLKAALREGDGPGNPLLNAIQEWIRTPLLVPAAAGGMARADLSADPGDTRD